MVGEYDRVRPHLANARHGPLHPPKYLRFGGDGQVVRAGPVVSRRERRHIVREGQKPNPLPTLPRHGKDGRSGGFFAVTAGPGVPDAGVVQVFDGVEQAPFLEVHGVVVGQRTGVDAGSQQGFDGGGWGPEVGALGHTGPRPLVVGEWALQVDDAQVGGVQEGPHVAPGLLGT